MTGILLLNASYEPLSILSPRRAVKLLLQERAEPATAESISLAGPSRTLLIPVVLRLKYYVHIPWRRTPVWSRRGLLSRDRYTCAYCGKLCSAFEATIDHILPVSRGGRSTWSNTVTACYRCNQRKADRTPHEAGMQLLIEPRRPRS